MKQLGQLNQMKNMMGGMDMEQLSQMMGNMPGGDRGDFQAPKRNVDKAKEKKKRQNAKAAQKVASDVKFISRDVGVHSRRESDVRFMAVASPLARMPPAEKPMGYKYRGTPGCRSVSTYGIVANWEGFLAFSTVGKDTDGEPPRRLLPALRSMEARTTARATVGKTIGTRPNLRTRRPVQATPTIHAPSFSIAPSTPAGQAKPSARRASFLCGSPNTAPPADLNDAFDKEVLVVVSKLKKYIQPDAGR